MDIIKPFCGIRLKSNKNYPLESDNFPRNYYSEYSLSSENKVAHINNLLHHNILYKDPNPCLYLYQLINDNQIFIGLISIVSMQAIDKKIHPHELILQHKKNQYINSLSEYKIQINPTLLVHKKSENLHKLYQKILSTEPSLILNETNNKKKHLLWVIDNPSIISKLSHEFSFLNELFIADGHHRISAINDFNKKSTLGSYFLGISAADEYVKIFGYNKLINDLNFLDACTFLKRTSEKFQVNSIREPVRYPAKGEYFLYLNQQWHKLKLNKSCLENGNEIIDATSINKHLFIDILGIDNPSLENNKISYASETKGLNYLCEMVDSQSAKAALIIPRVKISELYGIINKKMVLPPNSTWFEPKILDGIVSYKFE
jgi:uncharacterized protein (DUF1015 family)